MKTLVTGGAGYIGSVCAEELLNAGHEVTVFDNLSEGHRAAVDPRAQFVQGCLSHPAEIALALKASRAEAVLHFAAHALVGESMQNPAKYFRNNVAAGLNLLEACVAAGVKKIVFSSTCATYGNPDRLPIDESLPQNPINPYGESKLLFERILKWFRSIHGLEFVALRYFNAAGASQRFGEHHRIESHLIPNILRVALGHSQEVQILGTDYPTPDGTCIRDYVHVIDLADAHIRALQPGISGYFNLGSGPGVFRAGSHRCVQESLRQGDSRSRQSATRWRPTSTGSKRRQGMVGTGLDPALPEHRTNRGQRLGLAPAEPRRVPRLHLSRNSAFHSGNGTSSGRDRHQNIPSNFANPGLASTSMTPAT